LNPGSPAPQASVLILARLRATRKEVDPGFSLALADPLEPCGLSDFKGFCEVDLGLGKETIRSHAWRLGKFLEFNDKPLGDVTREDLRAFLRWVKENYTRGSYSNFLKTLKVFFRDYLGREDLVKTFKFPGWVPPKPIKLPTEEELRRFHEALTDLRMKVLFLFYATSGLRRCEVLGLHKEDVDLGLRQIVPNNHETNTTKNTWVTFYNEEAERVLSEYL